MGLRINSNIPAIIALRNLNATDARQAKSFERLSTGLRIVRPQDDPTGLAISESLRAQTRALHQATENARTAENLVNTADAALSGVNDLLTRIRRSVLAAMNDSLTPDARSTEQDFVDETIRSIGRAAETSRFGDIPLLNGQSGFTVESLDTTGLRAVSPTEVRFNPVTDVTEFSVGVTTSATQATVSLTSGVTGGGVSFEIGGPDGTATLTLGDGATATEMATAINSIREFTGIYAVGTDLFTEEYGSDATIRIRHVQGSGTVNGIPPGGVFTTSGVDAVATVLGESFTGSGNRLAIDTEGFRGVIELQPGAAVGSYDFSLKRSGLLLQMGIEANFESQLTVGIANVGQDVLGLPPVTIGGETVDGFLASLQTGGANDLEKDPANALRIIDRALAQVEAIRGSLGSVSRHVLEPTQRTNEVAMENLKAAESSLRDLDFAAESAEMARNSILFQAGTAVLSQASALPQTVLQLLQ